MISVSFLLLILLILALCSFFFSASETSIVALSKIRLRHMVANGIKRAKHIQNLVNNLDKFIVAILIGNNFVNIALSVISTAVFTQIFGVKLGMFVAALVTTLFVLIFCEITPKILAVKHTEKIALFSAPFMELVVKLLNPLINIFTETSNFILRMFNIQPPKRSPLVSEEELRLMIEIGKEEGVLTDEERKMLHRIFEFGDTRLSAVMAPKEKIVAVNVKSSSEELLDIFVEQGHARLPFYDGSIDNIVGIAYARDLLYILRDRGLFLLQDLMHKPYCVDASMRVNELLRKFQADKIQIAVVVDKDNKTLGLVTLEDLVEEIVGELEEDHSRKSK